MDQCMRYGSARLICDRHIERDLPRSLGTKLIRCHDHIAGRPFAIDIQHGNYRLVCITVKFNLSRPRLENTSFDREIVLSRYHRQGGFAFGIRFCARFQLTVHRDLGACNGCTGTVNDRHRQMCRWILWECERGGNKD